MASSSIWHSLPTEIKLTIVDSLPGQDLESFSKVDQRTYQVCVPAKFRIVKLATFQALQRFLDTVPPSYLSHIQDVSVTTEDEPTAPVISLRARTDAFISLLAATPRLSKLTFRMSGSLDKSIIAPFPYLRNLHKMSIVNCGDERESPLSERLVVSIAGSIPNLTELSLENISRSHLHASDLEGNPYIPVVHNDGDVPDHPKLGSELALPSLLRIPTLTKLAIRETHLGDERWINTPVACRLQVLDLGNYVHTDEDFNSACTQRIMSAVGPSVDEFSLSTAVSDDRLFAKPTETPLKSLRKLHISPFFPIDSVVDTVSNLAGSPIETLSLQCFEEDVVDLCSALEGFLSRRVERGPQFFDKLQRIDVTVAANPEVDSDPSDDGEDEERIAAAERLQNFCRDLRLASFVDKLPKVEGNPPIPIVAPFPKRATKARSNTI
ncbi:hypothetical protein FA15DRAFT_696963 [Coprinopsis marcescibilis]|uniref:F-box domain-containing protein n=1 Tax=Coprinopsis marcescibilis TaxID=230819 RepID=A0A5C3KWU0_COPMA|nr:hypothetical protein FA15DRAFT_696963 [Coprinopsis marcescibilis]